MFLRSLFYTSAATDASDKYQVWFQPQRQSRDVFAEESLGAQRQSRAFFLKGRLGQCSGSFSHTAQMLDQVPSELSTAGAKQKRGVRSETHKNLTFVTMHIGPAGRRLALA